MRFQIIFSLLPEDNRLPIGYQYYISSWIYSRIKASDENYARFLHDEGFGEGPHKFKLFNFGPLDLRPYRADWDSGHFELLGQEIRLTVSFSLSEMAQHFVKGVYEEDTFFIGTPDRNIALKVSEIRLLPQPEYQGTMSYRTVAPCCISRPARGTESYGQYLPPSDAEFVPRLIKNLKKRYLAAQCIPSGEDFDGEDENIEVDIQLLGKVPKSKLIEIRTDASKSIKVRGWQFDCKVIAAVEIQQFIWRAGLGEKGSMGFGMVEVLH